MLGSRLRRTLVLAAVGAIAAVACAPGASNNNPSTSAKGGSVTVIGTWSGSELDSFNAVVKPFTDQTGTTVNFEGARDQDAILSTRVAAGNPPDLAAAPGPTLLNRFAAQGKVVDLGKVLDTGQLAKDYSRAGSTWARPTASWSRSSPGPR